MMSLDLDFNLNAVQSQKLIITTKIKQALEILAMNSVELQQYITEQVESNPVLDIFEYETNQDDHANKLEKEGLINPIEEKRNDNYRIKEYEDIDYNEDSIVDKKTSSLSLKEYLLFQLNTSCLAKKQKSIGEYIIESIDDNGYLTVDEVEIAEALNEALGTVKIVLEHVQSFEPAGIGGKNLSECLIIQLKHVGNDNTNIRTIINNYLEDLACNKADAVAKKMNIDKKKVHECFKIIKTLDPKPGKAFRSEDNINYIIPDVTIRMIEGNYMTSINEDIFPELCISNYYKKIKCDGAYIDAARFINNKIDSALWLIKCIEKRKNTMKKIVQIILERQCEFFEKGKSFIKPLTMKTVASEISVHEATISRAVKGKYLQCQWGIFEMKFFFAGKLYCNTGEEISPQSIKMMLMKIIKEENKNNPYNDSDIVELMQKDGIMISRRTVAKYRMELDIQASNRRKYV